MAKLLTTDSMTFPTGAVVQSVRGRDRHRCYLVCGSMCDMHRATVYLADGAKRTPASPKMKNVKHLRLLGYTENAAELISQPEKISAAIARFDPIKTGIVK